MENQKTQAAVLKCTSCGNMVETWWQPEEEDFECGMCGCKMELVNLDNQH